MKSTISVIIPNYNREALLKETLQSLQKQTYPCWECLVIDDGSNDASENVVKSFEKHDSRFRWIKRIGSRKGASRCRNIGIDHSKGDFILFLDSDDLLQPYSLQQRIDVINESPDLDCWIFQTNKFENVPENFVGFWNVLTNENPFNRFLRMDPVWHTTGPIWKSDFLKKHLYFDEKLIIWEDVDFHLQALKISTNYQLYFHKSPDVLYRSKAPGSISNTAYNKVKRKSQIYFVKKYYQLLKEPEYRQILKTLAANLSLKNAESRYICNLLDLTFWAYRTKNLSIKEIIKIYRQLF
jgi:glycosyltransferase involved in cell wall biosynthesis